MANILLIEPDRTLARTYVDVLESAGHIVKASTTAQGALQSADGVRPDVVLLELQLVAHGGIEFLYEFRSYADWQEIPVAVVSNVPPAEFNQSVGVLTEHLGIATYCYKPQTNLQRLLRVVEDILTKQLKLAT